MMCVGCLISNCGRAPFAYHPLDAPHSAATSGHEAQRASLGTTRLAAVRERCTSTRRVWAHVLSRVDTASPRLAGGAMPCDACHVARALVAWWLDPKYHEHEGELYLCGHDSDRHAPSLVTAGWALIEDERVETLHPPLPALSADPATH